MASSRQNNLNNITVLNITNTNRSHLMFFVVIIGNPSAFLFDWRGLTMWQKPQGNPSMSWPVTDHGASRYRIVR
jgi:hypothetical protein